MRLFDQEKLIVGCLLDLDEVWHLCDFFDFAKELADPFTTGERLCHRGLFTSSGHPGGRRSLPANLDGPARKEETGRRKELFPPSWNRSRPRKHMRSRGFGCS